MQKIVQLKSYSHAIFPLSAKTGFFLFYLKGRILLNFCSVLLPLPLLGYWILAQ